MKLLKEMTELLIPGEPPAPVLCRVGGETLLRQERIPGEAPAD